MTRIYADRKSIHPRPSAVKSSLLAAVPRQVSVGTQQVPPYYGSCRVFHAVKTLHEGLSRDFPGKVEGSFFEIGKNVAKTCSVFLHKNVQHAVDEWWACLAGGRSWCGGGENPRKAFRGFCWRTQRGPDVGGLGGPCALRVWQEEVALAGRGDEIWHNGDGAGQRTTRCQFHHEATKTTKRRLPPSPGGDS